MARAWRIMGEKRGSDNVSRGDPFRRVGVRDARLLRDRMGRPYGGIAEGTFPARGVSAMRGRVIEWSPLPGRRLGRPWIAGIFVPRAAVVVEWPAFHGSF